MKHTPGPWEVNQWCAQVDPLDGEVICKLLWPTTMRDEDETKANARLIAAAPDLLEALLEAQECLVQSEYSEDGYARTMIREAIAKAKGGQP